MNSLYFCLSTFPISFCVLLHVEMFFLEKFLQFVSSFFVILVEQMVRVMRRFYAFLTMYCALLTPIYELKYN